MLQKVVAHELPHDGSNPATYVYDATAGTLTVSGVGAHIGLAKVHNTGEDGNSGGSITMMWLSS